MGVSQATGEGDRMPKMKRLVGAFLVLVTTISLTLVVAPAASAAPVGAGTYENTSSAIVFSSGWSTLTSSKDSGGSHANSWLAGATATFVFSGTSIQWISRKTAASGINDVYIDGVKVASVDRYSATGSFKQVVFQKSTLSSGTHTIRIVNTGARNSSATGTGVAVDAFVVSNPVGVGTYENTNSAVRYTGSWSTNSSTKDSGGSHASSYGASSSATLQFTGPTIQWISRKTPTGGINEVYIDGVKVGTVDRYDASGLFQQVVFQAGNLSAGTHTITIKNTNTKNASSTGTSIALDSFRVLSSVTPVGVGTYQNDNANISYSGGWTTNFSTYDSGGSHANSYSSAASASLVFTGTSVQWISRKTPASGINEVYIDGAKVATVDRYSPTGQFQQILYQTTTLAPGTHTITIKNTGSRNPNSTGTGVLVDAILVPVDTRPDPVTGLAVRQVTTGIAISWEPVTGSNLRELQLQRALGPTGAFSTIATLPTTATSYVHSNVAGPETYRYRVIVVDAVGRQSSAASKGTVLPTPAPPAYLGSDECPTATTTVDNVTELEAALAGASPGDVIRVANGTYVGHFVIEVDATADSPVWVCGSGSTILSGNGPSDGGGTAVLAARDSAHVILTGMTVTSSLKGVTVDNSSFVTLSDLVVENIGEEGIHLRSNTTDSVVAGSTVRFTGLSEAQYGEGVYVGSHNSNWCTYSACDPDRSDRNTITDNTITDTGAEAIDIKEGSADGIVSWNHIVRTLSTDRNIVVRGNGWLVADNTGTATSDQSAIRLDTPPIDGYGIGNVVSRNSWVMSGGTMVFAVRNANTVTCNNSLTGSASAMTNLTCQP